ncbi:hypothetical protein [Pyxidicoccus xibeiensis]|uniref:hypothetical protein n=1 Tax=Pyxidicoccus xibeiensis TaxID=2906759 RepID=UPI0020A6E5C0|nr:hypothetical protein [Pyxidicoccus xibeiensis]MCP3142110.1 hypothetical protein [Pyxidicoccus xibeiensis]
MQVKIHDALAETAILIASRRQAANLKGLAEEEKLWLYLRTLSYFVNVTGQVYRFEDALEEMGDVGQRYVSARMSAHTNTCAQQAVELLLNSLSETPSPEQQHVLVLVALINFIADTGQVDEVEDFFNHLLDLAPVTVAHFISHEEAEAWLKGSAEPPSPARILIGDEYYQFWYEREDNTRGMCLDYAIEPALEALTARGIPSQRPSFATRAEAEAWLMSHPANPYSFVEIAGEHYFAVHHPRLKRHSLHHVASALNAWEERKKVVEREAALEATAPSDGASE